MAKGKNVLTTGDVAKICNVAPRTVSKWFDSGQLKGYRIPGSKDRRIPLPELLRFMKANNMPTEALPVGKIRILVVDGSEHPAVGPAGRPESPGQLRGPARPQQLRGRRRHPEARASRGPDRPSDERRGRPGHLREHPVQRGLSTIKIIALANHLSSQESAALLQRGFDGYVSNPSDAMEVIRKIEEATAIIY